MYSSLHGSDFWSKIGFCENPHPVPKLVSLGDKDSWLEHAKYFPLSFLVLAHKIITNLLIKLLRIMFCAGLELLVLMNAGLKPAGGGGGCWGSSSAAGTWALLSSPESHKHRGMGECCFHASVHSFLWITQDLGSCCLLELHLWCAEPCRIHSDTHTYGFGMEKQIPCAETPLRRLREPGGCWPGHHSGPGEAAESQQRLPGLCPWNCCISLECEAVLALVSLGDLGPGCVTASTEETGSKPCQDYFW